MNVLGNSLQDHIGKQVIVVTIDRGAYLGTLAEFDKDFVALDDTYESSTETALTWHRVVLEGPVKIDPEVSETQEDSDVKLNLDKVLIQLRNVLRIWPVNKEI